jgi:hypothetical protein
MHMRHAGVCAGAGSFVFVWGGATDAPVTALARRPRLQQQCRTRLIWPRKGRGWRVSTAGVVLSQRSCRAESRVRALHRNNATQTCTHTHTGPVPRCGDLRGESWGAGKISRSRYFTKQPLRTRSHARTCVFVIRFYRHVPRRCAEDKVSGGGLYTNITLLLHVSQGRKPPIVKVRRKCKFRTLQFGIQRNVDPRAAITRQSYGWHGTYIITLRPISPARRGLK